MSEDEVVFCFVHMVVAAVFWLRWYYRLSSVERLQSAGEGQRGAIMAMFVAVLFVMPIMLQSFAASDVRSTLYVAWYALMGLAWLGPTFWVIELIGPNARLDVAERRNGAAAITLCGALPGLTLAFLGGNFGEGPGWWVVAMCAILSMGGLCLMWCILAAMGPQHEQIVVDRDRSVAVRIACLFIAAGLILGRAVAGDWVDGPSAFNDFVVNGWPVAAMTLFELAFGYLSVTSHRRLDRTSLLRGFAPAAIYLAIAAGWVVHLGWW